MRSYLRPARGTLLCGGVGLLLAGVIQAGLHAQDRLDALSEPAADISQSNSFGQPYERMNQGQRGGDFYQDDFQRRSYRSDAQTFEDQRYDDQSPDERRSTQFREEDRQSGSDGALGIVVRESDTGRGVQVTDIYRDSPAVEAGIRRGDRIIEVDGRQVSSVSNLQSIIGRHDPREQVEIVLVRDGRERVVRTQLESRREALSQNLRSGSRGQFQQDQDFQRQRYEQGASQQRLETRLASLEQRLARMLDEIRQLRRQVNGQQGGGQFERQDQPFSSSDWEQGQRSSYQQQQQQPRRQQTREADQFDRPQNQRDQRDAQDRVDY